MGGIFELTRETSETVIKRALAPLKAILETHVNQEEGEVLINLSDVKMIDADIGIIALTIATRFAKEKDYQTAIRVLGEEIGELQKELGKDKSESLKEIPVNDVLPRTIARANKFGIKVPGM